MTKAEFLDMWAKRTGSTLAEFEEMGIDAEPCDCGGYHCDGWLLFIRESEDKLGDY